MFKFTGQDAGGLVLGFGLTERELGLVYEQNPIVFPMADVRLEGDLFAIAAAADEPLLRAGLGERLSATVLLSAADADRLRHDRILRMTLDHAGIARAGYMLFLYGADEDALTAALERQGMVRDDSLRPPEAPAEVPVREILDQEVLRFFNERLPRICHHAKNDAEIAALMREILDGTRDFPAAASPGFGAKARAGAIRRGCTIAVDTEVADRGFFELSHAGADGARVTLFAAAFAAQGWSAAQVQRAATRAVLHELTRFVELRLPEGDRLLWSREG